MSNTEQAFTLAELLDLADHAISREAFDAASGYQLDALKALAARVDQMERDKNWAEAMNQASIVSSLNKRMIELEKRPAFQIVPHDNNSSLPVSGGPQREQPHDGHSGDCTFYSALINCRPFDGICTCGYGWRKWSEGDYSHMYSEEKTATFKPPEPEPPPREADAGQEAEPEHHEEFSLEELLRRYRNQKALLKSWSSCLDGIPDIQHIPGGEIDSARSHAAVRRIVQHLLLRDLRERQHPPPTPAATERQEQDWREPYKKWIGHQSWHVAPWESYRDGFVAGRESAQPQPAPDLGAAFEQWWENEGSKMPEWPPKPHAKQIFKAGAACRVSPWRDASKEKPEEGTPVWIAWNPPRGEKGEAWSRVAIYQKDGHWTSNLGGRINDRDPDYWLPLPPIPKGEAS